MTTKFLFSISYGFEQRAGLCFSRSHTTEYQTVKA